MTTNQVNAAIITIGDELLIGQTIDTNSAYIAQELNGLGIWVRRRVAIGDIREEILHTLEEHSREHQLIIITGGLGPTADDITKPALCDYFNAALVEDAEALENVRKIFQRFNRPLTERNIRQAEVPENCTVLQNRRGTAPGMWFQKDGVIYVSLPGVPHEMKGLMQEQVIPRLISTLSLPAILHHTLLTAGIGESTVADLLVDYEKELPPHIKLAYLPAYGMLRLRLTGRSTDRSALEGELEHWFYEPKQKVKEWMVIDEDISVEEVVSRLLKEHGKTLATAESCTGGYIAHLITSRAGSSSIFNGSVVSYANSAKEDVLKVRESTLQQHGAVSKATVCEMAEGVLDLMKTDFALACSGIMGPGGGTPEKPVGTVWIAVAGAGRTETTRLQLPFDRERNIRQTALAALNLLRRFLIEGKKES